MELRQLRSFIIVAEEGNISAAARRAHLTQPALSRQIKALEETLGVELLERGAHSVRLTPAGTWLADEARSLVEKADSLMVKVQKMANGQPLRIGYAPSLASGMLGVALETFSQVHPKARLALQDLSTAEMLDGICADKLDVVITIPPEVDRHEITWTRLRRPSWRVALSTRHPLAQKKVIQPRDLHGQKLLIFAREGYPDYWTQLSRFFRTHKVDPKVGGEFDGITSMGAALAAGLGIALLAESSVLPGQAEGRIVMLPMDPEPDSLCVCAGLPKTRESSLQVLAFVEELRLAGQG